MFRVGQKVVCIKYDAWVPKLYNWEKAPSLDCVYTIRAFLEFDGLSFLHLEEIANRRYRYSTGYHEAAFYCGHFRPIVARDTDISIFTAMLNPSLEDLRAIVRENANA